jgi:hypothetical protein
MPTPNDIVEEQQGVHVESSKYLVGARSVIMLHCGDAMTGGTEGPPDE